MKKISNSDQEGSTSSTANRTFPLELYKNRKGVWYTGDEDIVQLKVVKRTKPFIEDFQLFYKICSSSSEAYFRMIEGTLSDRIKPGEKFCHDHRGNILRIFSASLFESNTNLMNGYRSSKVLTMSRYRIRSHQKGAQALFKFRTANQKFTTFATEKYFGQAKIVERYHEVITEFEFLIFDKKTRKLLRKLKLELFTDNKLTEKRNKTYFNKNNWEIGEYNGRLFFNHYAFTCWLDDEDSQNMFRQRDFIREELKHSHSRIGQLSEMARVANIFEFKPELMEKYVKLCQNFKLISYVKTQFNTDYQLIAVNEKQVVLISVEDLTVQKVLFEVENENDVMIKPYLSTLDKRKYMILTTQIQDKTGQQQELKLIFKFD